jgi:tripartite ATP-independent transporter DctM subunit
MSLETLGLILLLALLFGIFAGFPIAFTLIILSVVFGYIGFGERVFDLMVYQAVGMMKEETFAAVPLFIFMGHLLEKSGLMERLFRSFQLMLGGLRGSLYLGVILTSTIFATATGIIGASVTVIGIMAAPQMIKSKYDTRLSAGSITAGGCLGILIPPSVMLVVMGPIVGVSVAQLYGSAILPGLLLSALYIGYTMIKSYFKPELGPPLPLEERLVSKRQMLTEFSSGIVPIGIVIFAALGSIILGLATPTEAAAMAATGSIILSLLYRRLKWMTLKEAVLSTLQTSSMVMFLAVASTIYGAVLTRLGTTTMLAKMTLGLGVSPMGMVALLMLVIFILGWPLEWPAIVFIFLPILLPVVQELKINLLWFTTLVAVNLQTAFLSPPVAMAAYYLKAVAPQWELKDIYWGMAAFMVLQMVGLAIVFFFPQIALWLPEVLFG